MNDYIEAIQIIAYAFLLISASIVAVSVALVAMKWAKRWKSQAEQLDEYLANIIGEDLGEFLVEQIEKLKEDFDSVEDKRIILVYSSLNNALRLVSQALPISSKPIPKETIVDTFKVIFDNIQMLVNGIPDDIDGDGE